MIHSPDFGATRRFHARLRFRFFRERFEGFLRQHLGSGRHERSPLPAGPVKRVLSDDCELRLHCIAPFRALCQKALLYLSRLPEIFSRSKTCTDPQFHAWTRPRFSKVLPHNISADATVNFE